MTSAAVLVVAKAPVAGVAKTRLAATVGDWAAAELAAAALLDTIEVCARTFDTCLLAVTGDLASGARGEQLAGALEGWTVFSQRGDDFSERLQHAHADASQRCSRPVLQVGMDTPQMTGGQLTALDAMLCGGEYDAVLGPADDGGWWALGVTDPALVEGLGAVPMSTAQTCVETSRLLSSNGATVGLGDTVRDVDEAEDAIAVSQASPALRFSIQWSALWPPLGGAGVARHRRSSRGSTAPGEAVGGHRRTR